MPEAEINFVTGREHTWQVIIGASLKLCLTSKR